MKTKILLVEDQSLIAQHQKINLEKIGYSVEIAYSNEEAVLKVKNGPEFDIALMDIDLGNGPDGAETAREILNVYDLPIIFLSNHVEKEVVEKTEKISSYGYVTKNSGFIVLDTVIKMALRLFEAKKKAKLELEERLAAEKALIENELKYTDLFMSMGQGFYISEIMYNEKDGPCDYRFLDVNPAFEKIVGLPKDKIVGRTYREIVSPDPESGWLDCFIRVAKTGKAENYDFASAYYNTHFETYAFRPKRGQFAALVKDVSECINAKNRISQLLEEKTLLIEETHHRMKNNMNVIQSLLSLQASHLNDEDAKAVLLEASERINCMRILYQKIFEKKNLDSMPLDEFVPSLINEIIAAMRNETKISALCNIVPVKMDIDKLSTLCVILNELVTNKIKFAFPDMKEGVISIDVSKSNDKLQIRIYDDGTDFPKDFRIENSPGFGMKLVSMLIDQMDGEFKIAEGGRNTFLITMPA